MTFQYKQELQYKKISNKHSKRMEFLASNIKVNRDIKREELRKFCLMKDRAIIDLGLDENETADLLERKQRVQYLGI